MTANNDRSTELLTLARIAQDAGDLRRAAMIYETLAKYLTAQSTGAGAEYLDYLVDYIRIGAD